VIGLLDARLVPLEKLCQEPVLCCSRPLNPVGQATSRSKGSRRQCAWVRGASEPAPPDDDWWAHQKLIRQLESAQATFYSKRSRRFLIGKRQFD